MPAPSADSAPALLCLDAKAILAQCEGTRIVPLGSIFRGPGKTSLAPNELLMEIEIPAPPPHSAGCYLRHTPREEMDIAVVGVAAFLGFITAQQSLSGSQNSCGGCCPDAAKNVPGRDFIVK